MMRYGEYDKEDEDNNIKGSEVEKEKMKMIEKRNKIGKEYKISIRYEIRNGRSFTTGAPHKQLSKGDTPDLYQYHSQHTTRYLRVAGG